MFLTRKLKELQQTSPHIDEIIQPIKSLGIAGFFYVRIYDNHEFIDLTSNPTFAEHYFRKFFASDYPLEAISDHLFIESGISLWELNPQNLIHQDGKNIFSYGNGITICEKQAGYKELYNFYSDATQSEMNRFYLSNIDFLKKFKQYFLKQAKPLIEEAKKNKYLLPIIYCQQENSPESEKIRDIREQLEQALGQNIPLSPREIQCLSLLFKGHSAKEIAIDLNLSPSTIKNYITNMKTKWNCKKVSGLVGMAASLGFLS